MKNLIFISQNQKLVNLNQVFRTFQLSNWDKPNFHTSKPTVSRTKPKYKCHNKNFSQWGSYGQFCPNNTQQLCFKTTDAGNSTEFEFDLTRGSLWQISFPYDQPASLRGFGIDPWLGAFPKRAPAASRRSHSQVILKLWPTDRDEMPGTSS